MLIVLAVIFLAACIVIYAVCRAAGDEPYDP